MRIPICWKLNRASYPDCFVPEIGSFHAGAECRLSKESPTPRALALSQCCSDRSQGCDHRYLPARDSDEGEGRSARSVATEARCVDPNRSRVAGNLKLLRTGPDVA